MDEHQTLDEQQVELIGTAALTTALIQNNFEVAHPMRDRGIDLIVFSDCSGRFAAIPIQVKAHTGTGLMIHRRYERIGGLVHAVVWNACTDKPRIFLFDQGEATALLPEGKAQAAYASGT